MNIFPSMQAGQAGPQADEPRLMDLASRAAALYRTRPQEAQELAASPGPAPSSSQTPPAGSTDTPVENIDPDFEVPEPPPYLDAFYADLKKNCKAEIFKITNPDGTVTTKYSYRKSIYEYMRNFSGAGDGKPTYKTLDEQLELIQWCSKRVASGDLPTPYQDGEPSDYALKQGLTETQTSLMNIKFAIQQWMQEIFSPSEPQEEPWQM
ncbi:MAG: hypothetical protein JWP38_741 [Herbaspirillum sp.]|nr:hypothetical protein [Herbaspirillum sp.]